MPHIQCAVHTVAWLKQFLTDSAASPVQVPASSSSGVGESPLVLTLLNDPASELDSSWLHVLPTGPVPALPSTTVTLTGSSAAILSSPSDSGGSVGSSDLDLDTLSVRGPGLHELNGAGGSTALRSLIRLGLTADACRALVTRASLNTPRAGPWNSCFVCRLLQLFSDKGSSSHGVSADYITHDHSVAQAAASQLHAAAVLSVIRVSWTLWALKEVESVRHEQLMHRLRGMCPVPTTGVNTAASPITEQSLSALPVDDRCHNPGCQIRMPLEALKKCSRCGVRQYCKRDCQVQHWQGAHKRECAIMQSLARPYNQGASTARLLSSTLQ